MPYTSATFGITFCNVVASYVFAVCNRGSVLSKLLNCVCKLLRWLACMGFLQMNGIDHVSNSAYLVAFVFPAYIIQEIFHIHAVTVNVQIRTVIYVNDCTQNTILLHFVYTQCNQLQYLLIHNWFI